jgi:hypothetical protein
VGEADDASGGQHAVKLAKAEKVGAGKTADRTRESQGAAVGALAWFRVPDGSRKHADQLHCTILCAFNVMPV